MKLEIQVLGYSTTFRGFGSHRRWVALLDGRGRLFLSSQKAFLGTDAQDHVGCRPEKGGRPSKRASRKSDWGKAGETVVARTGGTGGRRGKGPGFWCVWKVSTRPADSRTSSVTISHRGEWPPWVAAGQTGLASRLLHTEHRTLQPRLPSLPKMSESLLLLQVEIWEADTNFQTFL